MIETHGVRPLTASDIYILYLIYLSHVHSFIIFRVMTQKKKKKGKRKKKAYHKKLTETSLSSSGELLEFMAGSFREVSGALTFLLCPLYASPGEADDDDKSYTNATAQNFLPRCRLTRESTLRSRSLRLASPQLPHPHPYSISGNLSCNGLFVLPNDTCRPVLISQRFPLLKLR